MMLKILIVPFVFCLLSVPRLGLAEEGRSSDPRLDAARRAYSLADAAQTTGMGSVEAVYIWSVRWLETEGESCPSCMASATRVHRDRMRSFLARVRQMATAGTASQLDLAACEYYLAEAELWLSHGRGPSRRSP